MSGHQNAKILAGRPAVDFVGRASEAGRLAAQAHSAEGLLVLATPGAGVSELLRQTYDRLFNEHKDVIPFYFSIRRPFNSAHEIAEGFLNEFIRQLVAFRRREPAIVRSASDLDELAELSLSVSGIWIDRMIETARMATDGRSYVRTCLAAPIRAASHDARAFVMVDDLQELTNIEGGMALFDELKDIFENGGVPFAFSGNRRFLHGLIDCDRLEIDNLDFESAGRLVEVLGKENGVTISETSRDLIATQLSGNPATIRNLVRTARETRIDLNNFHNVQKAYASALFGGRLGREFDRLFQLGCVEPHIERAVIRLLDEILATSPEPASISKEFFQRQLRLSEAEATSLLERLNDNELVNLTSVDVGPVVRNTALSDYVRSRARLERGENRAMVVGDSLTEYIRRAPEIMARRYRLNWSAGVREVLGAFAGQNVPPVLIDYKVFRDELKGTTNPEDILKSLPASPSIALPRIFFTTTASAFYKPIARIAETERSAIALGFEAKENDSDDDVVWIAAEIDSKLEASAEVTEFWCDRLEAAAMMCDFARFKIWLIAPEGFSPDGLQVLMWRNAYGSSRPQVELLRRFLNAPAQSSPVLAQNEYEMVIPMGEDAELIAAHAVEEIARRHDFDPRSINQIKTALVEACINASEHSLSPDGKIYQRFRVEDDRVVLTVSNRGLRLDPRPTTDEPAEGRRGWGLKLMRQLMDSVTIEHVDDGTRIVMTKYLKAA